MRSRHTGRLRAPAFLSTTGKEPALVKQLYSALSVLANNTKSEIVETRILIILAAPGTAQ